MQDAHKTFRAPQRSSQ